MDKKLNVFNIAFMYLGAILGAGFASGREAWQFFGVFGRTGIKGAVLAMSVMTLIGLLVTYIANSKQTSDLGKLISPFDNKVFTSIIGWVLALVYYSMIIAMSAAGGSLLNQQFGLDVHIGGILIVVLVILTVLGDFERLSSVFGKLVPVLITVGIANVIMVLCSSEITQSGATSGFPPSAMAPTWPLAATIFVAYNSMGMISMAGNSALNAKNKKSGYFGSLLGTGLLALLTLLLLFALLKDMQGASEMDLPMLAFSKKIFAPFSVVYSIILIGSIYSTAASTYYGFSTKLPEGKYKKVMIIVFAIIGYLGGLTGFKTIVEYLYSAQGYIGIIIISLIVLNFLNELRKNLAHK